MLSSVEQQDKKGGLKQDMPDIYVSYLFQLLKWFFFDILQIFVEERR